MLSVSVDRFHSASPRTIAPCCMGSVRTQRRGERAREAFTEAVWSRLLRLLLASEQGSDAYTVPRVQQHPEVPDLLRPGSGVGRDRAGA